jgi:dipeptidyl aminopeptidase/acylaminoacyl peptidase
LTCAHKRTVGKDPKGNSYAIFTAPHNPAYTAPEGTKPPLIVNVHGGPTGNSNLGLNLTAQYWTSRGYAYVLVNYAGSTGYGREYWEALNYSWGIKDIDDTASCVAYLASEGLINGSKVGIVGSSAGGFTVLKSLVSYPTLYAAGNSLFGVGNLQELAEGTHKFESHYLYALLFKPDATEEEKVKVYHDRSPCFHADQIERPLLLLQGDINKVLPVAQAIEMERVVREHGGDVKLVIMKGEGHGFRMGMHVRLAQEEEEALWRRTLL